MTCLKKMRENFPATSESTRPILLLMLSCLFRLEYFFFTLMALFCIKSFIKIIETTRFPYVIRRKDHCTSGGRNHETGKIQLLFLFHSSPVASYYRVKFLFYQTSSIFVMPDSKITGIVLFFSK